MPEPREKRCWPAVCAADMPPLRLVCAAAGKSAVPTGWPRHSFANRKSPRALTLAPLGFPVAGPPCLPPAAWEIPFCPRRRAATDRACVSFPLISSTITALTCGPGGVHARLSAPKAPSPYPAVHFLRTRPLHAPGSGNSQIVVCVGGNPIHAAGESLGCCGVLSHHTLKAKQNSKAGPPGSQAATTSQAILGRLQGWGVLGPLVLDSAILARRVKGTAWGNTVQGAEISAERTGWA